MRRLKIASSFCITSPVLNKWLTLFGSYLYKQKGQFMSCMFFYMHSGGTSINP